MTARRLLAVFATALLGLVLAACSVGSADTPPDDEGHPQPPPGALDVGGERFPLGLGSYCWSGPADGEDDDDRLTVCADAIGIITATPYVRAAAGDSLTISGDLAAIDFTVRRAHLWTLPEAPVAGDDTPQPWEGWQPAGEPIVLDGGSGVLGLPAGLEAGEYLLAIYITHTGTPGDDASYGAVIEVR